MAGDYITLDAPGNTGTLAGEVARARMRHGATGVLVTEPGEHRLMAQMAQWPDTQILPDTRFIADRHGFAQWAQGRKGCAWSISIG
jgi:deoxyribodipyrimidine photolyase-related protein